MATQPREITDEMRAYWSEVMKSVRQADSSPREVCPICQGSKAVRHPVTGQLHACSCTAVGENRVLGAIGIPARFRECTFESFRSLCDEKTWAAKEHAVACCETYAREGCLSINGVVKHGLVLSGKFGVGKSGLASAICAARLAVGVDVRWCDHLQFCKKVQSTYSGNGDSEGIISAAAACDLLMFDDMGDSEQLGATTNDKRNITYDVLSRRHRDLMPLIGTTNLGIDAFIQHFGNRIFDRVWEMCHWIEVGGKNFRREA